MSLEHGQQSSFDWKEESTSAVGGDIEDNLTSMTSRGGRRCSGHSVLDYMKGVLTGRVLDVGFAAARERWHFLAS